MKTVECPICRQRVKTLDDHPDVISRHRDKWGKRCRGTDIVVAEEEDSTQR